MNRRVVVVVIIVALLFWFDVSITDIPRIIGNFVTDTVDTFSGEDEKAVESKRGDRSNLCFASAGPMVTEEGPPKETRGKIEFHGYVEVYCKRFDRAQKRDVVTSHFQPVQKVEMERCPPFYQKSLDEFIDTVVGPQSTNPQCAMTESQALDIDLSRLPRCFELAESCADR